MKKHYIYTLALAIIALASCTKKETVIQQYNPPAATVYGTWIMINSNPADSSKNYLVIPNNGSNFYSQLTEDKYGFRAISSAGVFSATDKQLIIASGGLYNYKVSNDSMYLFQSPTVKIILLKINTPIFTADNFVIPITIDRLRLAKPELNHFNYGFGFHKDTVFYNNNYFGPNRGYKVNLNSNSVIDSWDLGFGGCFFYNAGIVANGFNTSWRLGFRQDKPMGGAGFLSSNTLNDVRNLSINSLNNFYFAYQGDQKLFSGVEGGSFSKVFDFAIYNTKSAVYYKDDAFLIIKNNYLYKVKIAPKLQVLKSYYMPEKYDLNNISTSGNDVMLYVYNNDLTRYEFLNISLP